MPPPIRCGGIITDEQKSLSGRIFRSCFKNKLIEFLQRHRVVTSEALGTWVSEQDSSPAIRRPAAEPTTSWSSDQLIASLSPAVPSPSPLLLYIPVANKINTMQNGCVPSFSRTAGHSRFNPVTNYTMSHFRKTSANVHSENWKWTWLQIFPNPSPSSSPQ